MADDAVFPQNAGTGPAPPRSGPSGGWLRQNFGDVDPLRVIGGSILALLIMAAMISAVMFFAAAQLQARIAELNLNGAPLTIWRMDAFREEFETWTQDIRKLRSEIEKDQRNLVQDQREYGEMVAAHLSLEARATTDARALQQKIEAAAGTRAPASTVSSTMSEIITATELLLNDSDVLTRFKAELDGIKKRYADIEDRRAELKSAEARNHGFESWISTELNLRKERVDAAAKLFGETNSAVAPEMVERIVNVTAELRALADSWDGRIYHIALWTNDMLVLLLLLISMGVLGSALNLLAVFFANDKHSLSFGEYPLRLAFGAVLAIVMFIIAKAGVPILADTSKIGSNAPLNPYFISLLAVVSGLMSDRAMGTIRNVATTLLQSVGGGDYSQRYTRVALDAALNSAGRGIDGLASLLGISADETRKLFSGTDVVSPDRQKLIAAYLGRSPRELFSDLPAG